MRSGIDTAISASNHNVTQKRLPGKGREATQSRLRLETLESRELMSVSQFMYSGTTFVIISNNTDTSIRISSTSASTIRVTDLKTNQTWNHSVAGINRIQYNGGAGVDHVINGTSLGMTAYGGAGNDNFVGSTSASDTMYGGIGNDQLTGRGGADAMYGNDGDDTIISLDNGLSDYVHVGNGNDVVWSDLNGATRDMIAGVATGDTVHAVAAFTNSGADRTLTGDRILDPTLNSGHTYRRFTNNPLFGTSGPLMSDIEQGAYGNCWLLAGLSAIALDSPQAIRRNIVDFGDGTYGVKLGTKFYRVDDDLPVYSTNTNIQAAAGLGSNNSMWVAIYEKAYAHFRTGANSYGSCEGGWSVDVNLAFGSTTAGSTNLASFSNATNLVNAIYNRFVNDEAVTIGFLGLKSGQGSNPSPLVMSHMYTVAGFNLTSGTITSIIVRNPWGVDGGGNSDSNIYDGLVTLTPAQLFRYTGYINFGKIL